MMKHVILFSILLFLIVTELEGCRRCQKGIKRSKCLVNPCRGQKCKGAKCRPNYCGGCNRLWYNEGGSDVTKKCESEEKVLDKKLELVIKGNSSKPMLACEVQCPGFNCFRNPCDVESCTNHPNAICCPVYCNPCYTIWFENGVQVTCT